MHVPTSLFILHFPLDDHVISNCIPKRFTCRAAHE